MNVRVVVDMVDLESQGLESQIIGVHLSAKDGDQRGKELAVVLQGILKGIEIRANQSSQSRFRFIQAPAMTRGLRLARRNSRTLCVIYIFTQRLLPLSTEP